MYLLEYPNKPIKIFISCGSISDNLISDLVHLYSLRRKHEIKDMIAHS